jgi:hypothetical protein
MKCCRADPADRLVLSAMCPKAGCAKDVKIERSDTRPAAIVKLMSILAMINGSSGAKKPTYMSLIKCPMDKPSTRVACMGSVEWGRGFRKYVRICAPAISFFVFR